MRVIEKTIFKFDELDDSAKERAREYVRTNWLTESERFDCVVDDAVTIGALMGVEVDSRTWTNTFGHSGKTPRIYFDLYRRDCAVNASYKYAKGAVDAVRKYAPQDEEVNRIAAGLAIIQRRNFYQLRATMACGRNTDQKVDVIRYDEKEVDDSTVDELAELLKDFSYWILRQLEKEDEYQNSNEAVDEMLVNGEYEFYENGDIF